MKPWEYRHWPLEYRDLYDEFVGIMHFEREIPLEEAEERAYQLVKMAMALREDWRGL